MPAWLKIPDDSNNRAQSVPCISVTSLGRDASSDVCLWDKQVSRNHAMIRQLSNDTYYIVDMGSTNGTFLNGSRITLPQKLEDGDQVRIGDTIITFSHEVDFVESNTAQFDGATDLALKPQISDITVLVSDLRSFTPLVEKIPLNKLCDVMGEWFRQVSILVNANDGRVDKFIGDCVLARWDADMKAEESVNKALKLAIELNELTESMNQKHVDLPAPLKIGVGINTGTAVVDFGQESTVLGDTVNVAFRLESASKEVGKPIVISKSSYRYLPDHLWKSREQDITVKGKEKPITVSGFLFEEIDKHLRVSTP